MKPPPNTSSPAKQQERRHFPRIEYRCTAQLGNGQRQLSVEVLDISFKGVLAALIDGTPPQVGDPLTLTLECKGQEPITLQGKLAHTKGHFLGIECRALGIDNQARLRELLKGYEHNNDSVNHMLNGRPSNM